MGFCALMCCLHPAQVLVLDCLEVFTETRDLLSVAALSADPIPTVHLIQ